MHSSLRDNWIRLEMVHAIAKQLFDQTKHSEFRDPEYGVDVPFKFCPDTVTKVQQEAAIVGMVKAWSFVTLECLVNHALANVINNRTIAIVSIESPKNILNLFKGAKPSSQFGQKIAILNDDLGATYDDRREEGKQFDTNDLRLTDELRLADEIASIRNSVIHDKPFELSTSPEGEVEIKYFGTRVSEGERVRYSDLQDFFEKCDKLRTHILLKTGDDFDGPNRSFSDLLDDQLGN